MNAMTVKPGMNAMSVTEFGRRLGISRASAYRIIATGEVDLVDGKATGSRPRVRITEAALAKFIARREFHRSAA